MKILLTIVAVALASHMSGQKLNERKLPPAVVESLRNKYPNATGVVWEAEGRKFFEASFKNGAQDLSVVFDNGGVVQETELRINPAQFPAPVAAWLMKNYPGVKIKEASRITGKRGEITWEAKLKGESLLFDSEGNRL